MTELGMSLPGGRGATTARWSSAVLLRGAAVLFAAGLAVHTADHLRRGVDVLTTQVFWAGNVTTVVAIAALALVFIGHRWGPAVAGGVGLSQALGVAAVHLLPEWGAFSDSLSGGGVDAFSWVAVLAEIGAAATFGVAGFYALHGNGWRSPARDSALA